MLIYKVIAEFCFNANRSKKSVRIFNVDNNKQYEKYLHDNLDISIFV